MMRLSDVQKTAIRRGSTTVWKGAREVQVNGTAYEALARRGLAEVAVADWPYRRLVYRLTAEGEALRRSWLPPDIDPPPVEHTPIRVRCTFCGAEFPDGTPGGSCGRCGQAVEAI